MQQAKTSSPWKQLPNRRLNHPLNSRQPKEPVREKEVEDTMLDLLMPFTEGFEECDVSSSIPKARGGKHVDEEKPLDDKVPRLSPMRVSDTVATDTNCKKGIIGSQPRGNHNVFTHCLTDPNCEDLWEDQEQHGTWCRNETYEARGRDCNFYKNRRLDHRRSSSKTTERGRRLEMRTQRRS